MSGGRGIRPGHGRACAVVSAPTNNVVALRWGFPGGRLGVHSRRGVSLGSIRDQPAWCPCQSTRHRFVPHLGPAPAGCPLAIDAFRIALQRALPGEPRPRRMLDYCPATVAAGGCIQLLPPVIFVCRPAPPPTAFLVMSTLRHRPPTMKAMAFNTHSVVAEEGPCGRRASRSPHRPRNPIEPSTVPIPFAAWDFGHAAPRIRRVAVATD